MQTLQRCVFSPKAIALFVSKPAMVYGEEYGKYDLGKLVEMYGKQPIGETLQAAFMDLAVFCGGTKEPATLMPIAKDIATQIMTSYRGFKPAEVALFIGRFKRGDYDCVTFSGLSVMKAFKQFHQQRNDERWAIYQAEQRRRREAELNNPDIVTDPAKIDRILSQCRNSSKTDTKETPKGE